MVSLLFFANIHWLLLPFCLKVPMDTCKLEIKGDKAYSLPVG